MRLDHLLSMELIDSSEDEKRLNTLFSFERIIYILSFLSRQ